MITQARAGARCQRPRNHPPVPHSIYGREFREICSMPTTVLTSAITDGGSVYPASRIPCQPLVCRTSRLPDP
ncbi:MAG: hypothetical protein GPOALKHO_000286 [Sodalis sp.]|nr:MAG: hypothetical protein GPOALKHO_000286 [Sodalis sp.]